MAAALALLLIACNGENDVTVSPIGTPQPPAPGQPASRTVALLIESEAERERMGARIREAGYDVVESPDDAAIVLGDRPFEGAERIVVDAWVAVTDQRRDVLELTLADVRGILAGEIGDWSQLHGSEMPITVYLAEEDADAIGAASGLSVTEGDAPVSLVSRAALRQTVADEPGAFALIHPSELRPGVLALIVDGHDPLRDAERESPLRLERWIRVAAGTDAASALEVAGWALRDLDFHPVSLLATGEILPVRCTYEQISRHGYGAMFDGTRELLHAADVVVSQLDAALTDRVPPTPCESSVDLRAPTGVAEAIAAAGIDAMSTGTNHHMDCNQGACAASDAHFDTVAALEEAGILYFGSGENLDAARRPGILERDGVTFAFLGYDSVGSCWYGAGPDRPGTARLGWETLDALAEDVANAKAQADHVIVAFSWSGDCADGIVREYVTDPDDLQRTAAHIIARAGGTLIVGNGPHIVQASETIGELFVAYSLGNFIYDQDWSQETLDNMLMETGFTRERMIGYRMRPAVIREEHRPELVHPAGEEGRRILDRLWDATDALPPWTGRGAQD